MKKRIAVLTGAGVSAESGIKTFRGGDGLWENHNIEDVATPEGFVRNPQLVLDFYNQRRKQLLEVEPNAAHRLLAELENDFDVQIVTQNVDDLHERAGSANVLHLHGELLKVRSTGTDKIFELSKDNLELYVGSCCPDGYQLRPHIVWFGEAVPELENAIPYFQSADIGVVVGTSLQVYPAAGLIQYLKPEVPLYVIDPNKFAVANDNLCFISENATEGMRCLMELLLAEL